MYQSNASPNIASKIAEQERNKAGRLSPVLPSAILFSVLTINSIGMASFGAVEFIASDFSALVFLLVGGLYRGSMTRWWSIFAPGGFLLLLLPIGVWESTGQLAFTGLLRGALAPMLSFIAASLLAAFRNPEATPEEIAAASARRNRLLLSKVRTMEKEMQTLMALHKDSQPEAELTWGTKEFLFTADHSEAAKAPEASAVLSHEEVQTTIHAAIDQVRRRCLELGISGVRLTLTAPTDISLPMAVRGSVHELREILALVFEQAAVSIGTTRAPTLDGMVRASLRPSPGSLSIVIEDNGRGFNDVMLARVSPSNSQKWTEVRARTEIVGWTYNRQSRLGVGSRVAIELPRVDAFAPRSQRSIVGVTAQTNDAIGKNN